MAKRIWNYDCHDCGRAVMVKQSQPPFPDSRCASCHRKWQRETISARQGFWLDASDEEARRGGRGAGFFALLAQPNETER